MSRQLSLESQMTLQAEVIVICHLHRWSCLHFRLFNIICHLRRWSCIHFRLLNIISSHLLWSHHHKTTRRKNTTSEVRVFDDAIRYFCIEHRCWQPGSRRGEKNIRGVWGKNRRNMLILKETIKSEGRKAHNGLERYLYMFWWHRNLTRKHQQARSRGASLCFGFCLFLIRKPDVRVAQANTS